MGQTTPHETSHHFLPQSGRFGWHLPCHAGLRHRHDRLGAVGNINNANDAATGSVYGAVAYAYKIAKNETTISQYAEFLNAVAATDTYSLYSTSMTTTSTINGISRSGSSGAFTYSVAAGSGNKPITF